MSELNNLKRKVDQYKQIVANTREYRTMWQEGLKDQIVSQLETIVKEVGFDSAEIECRCEVENLEAIVLSLGTVKSGIYTEMGNNIKRHLIKQNGSLVYQQLFNGKIIVMINYPYIENYGQPHPPKTIAIYRPEELKPPFVIRHFEDFIRDITDWEDYDDDEPNKRIGFKFNFEQPAHLDDGEMD